MARLKEHWHNVRHGFWFVPGTIVAALAALALVLVGLDRALGTEDVGVLFSGDASAARGILSTIAAATATIAGVVFSITIVTLQLVSSQFSPRALRGFVKDPMNQVTAGVFVGTFVYCLLVLRTVRASDNAGGDFVPALAVTTGTVLGLASLVLLLFFVHHIASSIQVSSIAEKLGREAIRAVDRLYPEPYGEGEEYEDGDRIVASWHAKENRVVVCTDRPGYVQAIVLDDLVRDLESPGLRLRVVARPGDFVTERDPILVAWNARVGVDEVRQKVRSAVDVASQRDTRDDVAFALRQLSDIAVRALSPSLNDPTTALTCLGYLRAALEQLAARGEPPVLRRFGDAHAVVSRRSFADHLAEAFVDVGRHASNEPRVAHALLVALRSVAEAALEARAWSRVAHVVDVAEAIGGEAVREARSARDRELLEGALAAVREAARGSAAVGRM